MIKNIQLAKERVADVRHRTILRPLGPMETVVHCSGVYALSKKKIIMPKSASLMYGAGLRPPGPMKPRYNVWWLLSNL